jgi:hypothetical protein
MPGSSASRPPWRVALYVDAGASAQREALETIFLGRAGGTAAKNYALRIGEVYAVRPAVIELDHTPGRERLRVGTWVEAATARLVLTDETISCGIPGHDHPGQELIAETMHVDETPLRWTIEGQCGFATDFDYRHDD